MNHFKKGSIALIIVTYNQKDITKKTLRLLQEQTVIPDIVVVDNFSNDGTKEEIEKEFPNGVKVLRTKNNYGGSGGQYIGTRYAYEKGYEWIIMSDNDAFPVSKNLIEELVKNASENTITQPWNVDEDTKKNYTTLLFHYGCFHRSSIKRIGLPVFNFFLFHDDTEYIYRARQKNVNIKKIVDVKYSHPLKHFYAPNRFYFLVRNGLFVMHKFSSVMNNVIEFYFIINSLFVYRYIGETNYFSFGVCAIRDFIFGRFNNKYIISKSKIYSKQRDLPTNVFKERYAVAFYNIEPYINKKLKMQNNRYPHAKSFSSIKELFSKNIAVQGSIVCNTNLILSFFCPVIICIDEIRNNTVYYRKYQVAHLLFIRVVYLLLWNIIFLPLTIIGIIRLLVPIFIKQKKINYKKYLV